MKLSKLARSLRLPVVLTPATFSQTKQTIFNWFLTSEPKAAIVANQLVVANKWKPHAVATMEVVTVDATAVAIAAVEVHAADAVQPAAWVD